MKSEDGCTPTKHVISKIFSIFHDNFLEKIIAFFCSGNFAGLLWAAPETSTFALKLICLPGARLWYMDRIHVPRTKTQLLTRSPVLITAPIQSVGPRACFLKLEDCNVPHIPF